MNYNELFTLVTVKIFFSVSHCLLFVLYQDQILFVEKINKIS